MKSPSPRTRKQKIIRYSLLTILALFVLLVLAVIDGWARLFVLDGKPLPPPENKFITAVPVNLDQIAGISKFRSCQGHDMSAKGESGEIENNRSMKHYLAPTDDIRDKLNTIEIHAPFDGEVVLVFPGGKGNEMLIMPKTDKKFAFQIFHIDQLEGIKTGTKVKSGQLIGYANVKDRHDFDIGLSATGGTLIFEVLLKIVRGTPHFMMPKGNYLISPFDYMTDDVLAQFKAAGFNTAELKHSKDYRDKKSCSFDKKNSTVEEDWQYKPGHAFFKKPAQPIQQPEQDPPPQLYPSPN